MRPRTSRSGGRSRTSRRTVPDGAVRAGGRRAGGTCSTRRTSGFLSAHAVTNEVQFYESGDLRTVWNKLHLEGVTDFTVVSPGKEPFSCLFRSGAQGPARRRHSCSWCRASPRPCRRRPSSRATRSR